MRGGRPPIDTRELEAFAYLADVSPSRLKGAVMYKFLVWVAAIGIVGLLLVGVVAPATPDGSWLHEFGEDVEDAMSAWFGNPVTVE
jgi:hypothetical protein